jgi:hypothetical protein
MSTTTTGSAMAPPSRSTRPSPERQPVGRSAPARGH